MQKSDRRLHMHRSLPRSPWTCRCPSAAGRFLLQSRSTWSRSARGSERSLDRLRPASSNRQAAFCGRLTRRQARDQSFTKRASVCASRDSECSTRESSYVHGVRRWRGTSTLKPLSGMRWDTLYASCIGYMRRALELRTKRMKRIRCLRDDLLLLYRCRRLECRRKDAT